MTDINLTHLLLIGAYRDNEVDEHHPLSQFIREIEKNHKVIPKIHLGPLTNENYEELFKDSFYREKEAVKPFAALIHKRTEGNPFFCKQVINRIYKEKLLFFDYDHTQWDWKLEEIEALKVTDNVVEFMLAKIQGLPEETQKILQYASCIGNRFRVDILMITSEQSADAIGKALFPALEQELILSVRLGYKRMEAMRDDNLAAVLSKDITYQFVHDRIQQAVYQGISQEKKPKMHLSIARLLLKNESDATKSERLFEITDHFNQAHSLLLSTEIKDVVNLNYEAAIRARNANGYQSMFDYLKAALRLMDDGWWSSTIKSSLKSIENTF